MKNLFSKFWLQRNPNINNEIVETNEIVSVDSKIKTKKGKKVKCPKCP